MNNRLRRFLQIVVLVVVMISVYTSVAQLNVKAGYCGGVCDLSGRCASGCFCNGRSGTCE
jgi:hypothetical protein